MSDSAHLKPDHSHLENADWDYDWQQPCFLALREREESKIPQRLLEANAAIQARLSRLEPWPDGREMTALNEAVQALRELRKRYPL
jgi:hypothetical protein